MKSKCTLTIQIDDFMLTFMLVYLVMKILDVNDGDSGSFQRVGSFDSPKRVNSFSSLTTRSHLIGSF